MENADILDVPASLVEAYKFRLPRAYYYGDYIWPGLLMTPEKFKQIREMQFRPSDILIASYPKSGTTWVSEVVSLTAHKGDLEKVKHSPLHERVPWLELDNRFIYVRFFSWWQGLSKMTSTVSDVSGERSSENESTALTSDAGDGTPRVFFTHLPLELMPKQALEGGCRIIYISRNPKDTAVSFYHFHKMARYLGQQKTTWEEFFPLFASGKLYSGPWFEHVLSFWEYSKVSSNILFVKYEDMKKDLRAEVSKICSFLDIELDPPVLDTVVDHCSFCDMKQNKMVNREGVWLFNHKVSHFMRKGTVGDWKNYFTVAQNEAFDAIYREKIKASGLEYDFEL